MKQNEQRIILVNKIVKAENGFHEAMKELSRYGWDFNGTPSLLDEHAVKEVLSRYLNGKLLERDVYTWADFLELRDDVDYTGSKIDVISEVMHKLANPDIEGKLTVERAKSFMAKLQ